MRTPLDRKGRFTEAYGEHAAHLGITGTADDAGHAPNGGVPAQRNEWDRMTVTTCGMELSHVFAASNAPR